MSKKKDHGYVYVLSNPCFRYLKIGYTTNDVQQRCDQLSRSQSVPADFHVEFEAYVKKPRTVETATHAYFADKRVGKEFFDVKVDDVKKYIDENYEWMSEIEHLREEFAIIREARQSLIDKRGRYPSRIEEYA